MDFDQSYNSNYGGQILLIDKEMLFFIFFLIFIIFVTIIFFVTRAIVRKKADVGNRSDMVIQRIRIPKNKPGDENGNYTVQMLHEELAKGETIFSSIGGLQAQRGFMAWYLGRNDHFSFEIVALNKKIYFYIITPQSMQRYIEQQVHAHYPDAIIEVVQDYNIFSKNSHISSTTIKTRRKGFLPIKTYKTMDADAMHSIINVMSKLDKNEGMAIQFIVRSAKASWHAGANKVAQSIREGCTMNQAISKASQNAFFSLFNDIVSSAKPKDNSANQATVRLSAMEEEMLKGIQEKNSKAGLDVNLRIIVSSESKSQASTYIGSIGSAFTQYNLYEYGNSFPNAIHAKTSHKIINDFIHRRFDEKISFLLNTEELAGLFHLPLRNTETPNIAWLNAKYAAAPTNIPKDGIIIGHNVYRGVVTDIRMSRADRRRHSYIIGKSGVGKSVLIANMAIQDVLNGEGVCVMDPHGDLINDILKRVPPERAEDVILFSPADMARPLALNLMEYDERYPEQKTFVINEMINIFDKLYDLKATGGPIFEQYMRNAMLLIMSDPASGSTLMEIPRVLADPAFRKMKLEKCPDPTVVDFWKKEAEKAGGDAALANVVPYVTSKLTQFISNDTMRPIIGQQKSSFNFRDVMDSQKILLVDLSKGQIGEMNSFLLGMIIVGKILMSALSRADMPEDKRKDFYLYIDEFQNFTTDSICSILSEARKYGLNLIMAHQYIGQLVKNQNTSIRDAIFGNVGSWMVLKVGSDDAEAIEKEFSPVFNKYDLINIEKYTAYVKLLIDNTASRPFSMSTPWPLPGVERDDLKQKIKNLSRLKYGQDRQMIEAGIRKRSILAG
jgi:hypothetical protein